MFTTIIHPLRKALHLSCNEYCVLDTVYCLSNNTKYMGWCIASKNRIAEDLDLSRQSVSTIISSLVDRGFILRHDNLQEGLCASDEVRAIFQEKQKWIIGINDENVKLLSVSGALLGVKKVDTGCQESLHGGVKKVDTIYTVYNNSNTNTGKVETFDKFWEYYKKGSKKLARERFMKLTDDEIQRMRKHLPAYFKANPDAKFRKDAERYLSNKLWENDDVAELSKTNELPKDWWNADLTKGQWALLTPHQRAEKENNDMRKKMGI